MLVEYELPAVIRSIPARSSKERHTLCKIRGQSDIREVSGSDAPLLGVIHRAEGKSKYRLFDGQLHAVVGRFSDLRKGVGSKRFLRRTSIEARLMDAVRAELEAQPKPLVNPDSQQILAQRINQQFKFHEPPDLFTHSTSFEAVWNRIPLFTDQRVSENGAEDAERWRLMADVSLAGVILCEDSVWTKVPEPCIAIFPSPTKTYTAQGDTAFYESAEAQPLPHGSSPLYWRDVQDVCFSVNDWDKACAFTDRHIAEIETLYPTRAQRMADIVRIEVFDPDAFSFDFETAEFRRLADRVSHLATTAMRVPSKPKTWQKRAPDAFIDLLQQLDQARYGGDEWHADTETALENILDATARLGSVLSTLGLNCEIFHRSIERGLERWADRAISLAPDGSAASMAWSSRW
jgi:hypothetical protein